MTEDELRAQIDVNSTTWAAVVQHCKDLRAENIEALLRANDRETDLKNKARADVHLSWLMLDEKLRKPRAAYDDAE